MMQKLSQKYLKSGIRHR